jgi:hypothetical protein
VYTVEVVDATGVEATGVLEGELPVCALATAVAARREIIEAFILILVGC